MGHQQLKALNLINLGELHVHGGEYGAALADCEAGVGLMRQVGDQRLLAYGLQWLGLAHHGLQDEVLARRYVGEALETALVTRSPPAILGVMAGAAILLRDAGARDAAVDALRNVVRHPATEQGRRAHARGVLDGMGVGSDAGKEAVPDEAALEGIVADLLAALSIQAAGGTES